MKVYTGTIKCTHCYKEFNWKYIDDGFRPWMLKKSKMITTVTSHIEDKNVSLCTHKIDYKTKTHYFIAQCTHCHVLVSFQCNEDIVKELLS